MTQEMLELIFSKHLDLVDGKVDEDAMREALVYWTFNDANKKYTLSLTSLRSVDRFLTKKDNIVTWLNGMPRILLDHIAHHCKEILTSGMDNPTIDMIESFLIASHVILFLRLKVENAVDYMSEETSYSICDSLKMAHAALSSNETASDDENDIASLREKRHIIAHKLADILITINADSTNVLLGEYLSLTLETLSLDILLRPPQPEPQPTSPIFSLLISPCVDIIVNLYIRSQNPSSISLEISSYVPKLAEKLRTARNYKCESGKAILSLTAIILKTVENRGAAIDNATKTLCQQAAESPVVNTSHVSLDSCIKCLSELQHSAVRAASELVELLVDRCVFKATTQVSDVKELFIMFTEDTLALYGACQFSSIPLVLEQIVLQLVVLVDDAQSSAIVKCIAIEVLGSIIAKLRSVIITHEKELECLQNEPKSQVNTILLAFAKKGQTSDEKLSNYISIMETEKMISKSDWTIRRSSYYFFKITKLASIISESEVRSEVEKYAFMHKLLNLLSLKYESVELQVRDVERRLLLETLASDAPVTRYWPVIIQRLSNALLMPQITIRTKALRALKAIADCDVSLLNRREIAPAIGKCIQDKSAQVREAAIDLIGKQAIVSNMAGDSYLEIVLSKTNDPSLAVRKCTLRFLRDAFMADNGGKRGSRILSKVLLLVGDQSQTLKAAATVVLDELLFGKLKQLNEFSSYRVLNDLTLSTKLFLQSKIMQLTEIFKVKEESLSQIFSDYLRIQLKQNSTSLFSVFQATMDVLFEILLLQTAGDESHNLKNHLSIISIFATAQPKLLRSDQLALLLPYLKGIQCPEDAEMFNFAISVMRRALLHSISFKRETLIDMRKSSLLSMTKVNNKGLREAIPCICVATQLLGDYQTVTSVLSSCEQQLQAIASQIVMTAGQVDEKRTSLLLLLVSSFAQYFKFPVNDSSVEKYFPNCGTPGNVAERILLLVQKVIQGNISAGLKRTAIMSYGYICQGHPTFFRFPFSQTILRSTLEAGDVSLNTVALLILQDSFALENEIASIKAEEKPGDSSSVGIDLLTGNSLNFEQEGYGP